MNDADGSRLKSWRTKKGLSQRDLAAILERSQSFVGNIEAGKTGLSRDLINRMAERTTVNVSWLVTGDGPMDTEEPLESSARPVREDAQTVKNPKIDPIRLMICRDLVADIYRENRVPLSMDGHFDEAVWAYNELLNRVADPEDGDEMEAVLPQVRHLLRKKLSNAKGRT